MATKTQTPTAAHLDEARAEVSRIEQLVATWDREAENSQRALVDIEARRGGEVLAAGDDGPDRARELAREVAELREQVETARAAARAADAQLEVARRQVLVAEAADLRAQSARLDAEADRRQVVTDELLAKLSEHEGLGSAVVWRPMAPVPGEAKSAHTPDHVPARTETGRLRAEALRLRGEAIVLEGKAAGRNVVPPDRGFGPDVTELARQESKRETVSA